MDDIQLKIKELVSKLIPIKCRHYECKNCYKSEDGFPECGIILLKHVISYVEGQDRKECPYFISRQ